jgi:UDP-2-acetamido-3-amino-2,3-dideoxy-glucuronate N-acetyltransferase
MARIAATAVIEPTAVVADSATVWDHSQIRAGAVVGEECVIGRNVFVDAGVEIGRACKVQNNALLYAPARIGDGVFIGPAAVLTNDRYPRAVDRDGRLVQAGEWTASGVTLLDGVSVGASVTVIGGVTVGRWAVCAAGAVVTSDVGDFALVAGVPARRVAWVGHAGRPLDDDGDGAWRCPVSGARFVVVHGQMQEEA